MAVGQITGYGLEILPVHMDIGRIVGDCLNLCLKIHVTADADKVLKNVLVALI